MSFSKQRNVAEEILRQEWDRRWERREPLRPPERAKLRPVSLLDRIAAAGESAERLLKWLPARYDGYHWWRDTLPKRQVIRDSVLSAVRREGYTAVPPKLVDKIVSKIIDRARARGLKPHEHRGDNGFSAYCSCRWCKKLVDEKIQQVFGSAASR